jgi:putative ABC transport system permease protein
MNIFKISWSNIKDKPLTSCLSILLMALGVGIISFLLLISKQIDDKFNRNIEGIHMVVGAKGSPLQLILATIYQIDAPTGNIKLSEANGLMRNPMVKTAIPLSMGDSYQGYRILGTNEKYLSHFKAEYQEGKTCQNTFEVVLGANAAKNLELKMGDSFASSHGYYGEGDKHEDKKYKVVGILKPNNSVVDQLIITPLASVWAVHEGHGEEAHDKGANALKLLEEPNTHEGEQHEEVEDKEITAMLIEFRNPAMGMMTARGINENTNMQTASPAIEINRLLALLGVGLDSLKIIALIIILVAGISVLVALYNTLKERKYEMALMLSMGASRIKLFFMLLLEGLIISTLGYILGILLSRLGLFLMANKVEKNFHYDFNVLTLLSEETTLLGGALLIGLIAAAIPSLGIYKINISKTLADES